MASQTSLIFNLIARDRASKALGPVAARLKSFGTNITKAVAGVGVAAPHVAAAATAAAALSAAGAAAAVGITGFAAAVKPQLASVTDTLELYEKTQDNVGQSTKAVAKEQKQYQAALKDLPGPTRTFAKELNKLKSEHKKWSAGLAKDTMPVFVKGIKIARSVMPQLTPVVRSVSKVLNGFLSDILRLTKTKQFKQWVKDFSNQAGTTLRNALVITRNLLGGLIAILHAFLPETRSTTGGLVNLSAAFSEWAKSIEGSEGLDKFLAFGQKSGPMLANLGTALVGLGSSLAPFAGSTIIIANALADVITNTPAPVITALGQAFLVAAVAARTFGMATMIGGTALRAFRGARAVTTGLIVMAQGFRNAAVAQSAFSGAWGTAGGKLRSFVNAIGSGIAATGRWIAAQARAAASAVASAARTSAAWVASTARTAAAWTANAARAVASASMSAGAWVAAHTRVGAAFLASSARVLAHTAAIGIYRGVTLAVSAATKVWAAGQWLLNAALTANPIGVVVMAIAALVGIVVLAYKKNETFRKVCQAAWAGVKVAVSAVVNWLRANVPPVWARITAAVRATTSFIRGVFPGVKNAIVNSFSLAKAGAVRIFSALVGWFTFIPRKFAEIGANIVSGLWNGISARWGAMEAWVKGKIAGLSGIAKRVLQMRSPSRVFRKHGMNIAAGMALGIKTGWKGVLAALERGLQGIKERYDKAKTNLSSVKQKWSQSYTAVRDAFLGQGVAERGDSFVQIVDSLRASVASNRQMSNALRKLKGLGLNKAMLRQFAEAGPGALAQALSVIDSGKGGVRTLNGLQGQLSSGAKRTGRFTADTMYGKELRASAVETRRLARYVRELTVAIKYSKSRMKKRANGGYASGLTLANERGGEVFDLPNGTRVFTAQQSRNMVGADRSSQPARVVLSVEASDSDTSRFIAEMIKRYVRVKGGGSVQVAFGKGSA